jgi:hypothetical protein
MGAYNGTVPTFLAGEVLDADKLTEVSLFMTAMTGAWTAYTPTLANLTLGNGVMAASYRRIGHTLELRFRFTFGTTSVMGTNPTFSLPAGMSALNTSDIAGDMYFQDTGASTRRGQGIIASATTIGIFNFSTTGVLQGTSSTVPHTWASTDIIFMNSFAIELA